MSRTTQVAIGLLLVACATSLARADEESAVWWSKSIRMPVLANGHRPVVTGVSLSPDGSLVAVAGDDHKVRIWDVESSELLKELGHHTDLVRAAVFDPQGKWLATAGNDRSVILWSTSSWQPLSVVRHPDAIAGLAFAPDSRRLVTAGFEPLIRVYSISADRLELERELSCDCRDMRAVAISANQRWIAAAGRNGHVHLWDANSGEELTERVAHRHRVRRLAFVSGDQLLSVGEDRQIRRWKVPGCESQSPAPPLQQGKMMALAVCDGELYATGGSDNQIRIWRLDGDEPLNVLDGHEGSISCLDYRAKVLVSGSFDTTIRIWSRKDRVARTAPSSGVPNELGPSR